jgi:Autotransporter beta-domain
MGEGSDILSNFGVITGNNGLAVNMEGGSDTVSINAGSRITGLVNGGTGTDTLNYNKVGLTEAKRAALQAGQTVNIGGTLYTSFEVVTGVARSFSSFATNGTTAGIAALFDNGSTTTGAGANMVALIDTVASASDVGAALAQLTPTAFQAFTNFGINNALMTTSLIGNRLAGARQGGLTFDMSGAATATAMFNAGMFAMKGTPGTDQIAALVADPIAALDATAFADPAAQFDQHAAYAGFARGPSGNVHKAPAAAPAVVLDNGFFISSGYLVARQGARENAPATRFNTASVVTGVDRRLTDNIVAGVFAGFARTYGDLDTLGSTTASRPAWAVPTAAMSPAPGSPTPRSWSAAAPTRTRALRWARPTRRRRYAVQAAGGFDARFGAWQVTPEVGAQYTRVNVDGFTETGSPAALVVASDEASSLRSSLGARVRYDWAAAWGVVTPEWRIAWQHEFLNGARDLRASFIDAAFPGQFLTTTGAPGRDFVLVGTGVGGRLGAATTVSLDYDALIGTADFVAHRVTGRFRHMF